MYLCLRAREPGFVSRAGSSVGEFSAELIGSDDSDSRRIEVDNRFSAERDIGPFFVCVYGEFGSLVR